MVILLHFSKIFPVTFGIKIRGYLSWLLTSPHKLQLPAISQLFLTPRSRAPWSRAPRSDERSGDTHACTLCLQSKPRAVSLGWMEARPGLLTVAGHPPSLSFSFTRFILCSLLRICIDFVEPLQRAVNDAFNEKALPSARRESQTM